MVLKIKQHNLLNLILLTVLSGSISFAQQAQQSQQQFLSYFGAQIGNEIDTTTLGCYIGTAGTLVSDNDFNYILSNSHVLAREGVGVVGEDIMHTVSSYCNGNAIHVGELAADIPLAFGRKGTNLVDAALARITPNVKPASDQTGVLHIGKTFDDAYGVTNNPVDPVVDLAVKKSGRTTGLTTSKIRLVGVNVVVRYNGGRAYFTDQFVVSGSGFSDSGDSGSLIVTDADPADPVGLLFAGSSSDTIGNPIKAVIDEFKRVHGIALSFGANDDIGTFDLAPPTSGGGNNNGGKPDKSKSTGRPSSTITGKSSGIEKAIAVRDRNEARYLDSDGILGSGIGLTNGSPSITVFVNKDNPSAARNLPTSIEGIPVNVNLTEPFKAF